MCVSIRSHIHSILHLEKYMATKKKTPIKKAPVKKPSVKKTVDTKSSSKKSTKKTPPVKLERSITIDSIKYTAQDCIDALLKLQEEFAERRITRNTFRMHQDDIPEKAWDFHFGSFTEFSVAAGLTDSRYSRRFKMRTAQHSSVDNLRKIGDSRRELGDTYTRDDPKKRYKTLIGCSDLHDIECDPFYLRVLCDTIKRVEPDVTCIDGDLFDLAEFGKYQVDPREWDVSGRINAGREILKRIRDANPDGQIDFIEGNHEARLLRHITENSPALMAVLDEIHDFDISKLFKLNEFEVNYISRCDLHTFTDPQLKKEIRQNYKIYWGSLLAHHHPEGRLYGLPGFNGHHHCHLVESKHNIASGTYEWQQLGAGHMRTAPYCDGDKWNNGFIIAFVDTWLGEVNFEYVTVGSTIALSAGKFYTRDDEEFYAALVTSMDNRKKLKAGNT